MYGFRLSGMKTGLDTEYKEYTIELLGFYYLGQLPDQQLPKQRLPRLQLFSWLGVIESKIALFITTITGDLQSISDFLFCQTNTCDCGWSSINCNRNRVTVWPLRLFLVTLFLLFSFGFVRELFGFGAFFCLISCIFGLQSFLVSLIISRIETSLQGLFCLEASLILIGTLLNLGPGLSLIYCTYQIILGYILAYVNNL